MSTDSMSEELSEIDLLQELLDLEVQQLKRFSTNENDSDTSVPPSPIIEKRSVHVDEAQDALEVSIIEEDETEDDTTEQPIPNLGRIVSPLSSRSNTLRNLHSNPKKNNDQDVVSTVVRRRKFWLNVLNVSEEEFGKLSEEELLALEAEANKSDSNRRVTVGTVFATTPETKPKSSSTSDVERIKQSGTARRGSVGVAEDNKSPIDDTSLKRKGSIRGFLQNRLQAVRESPGSVSLTDQQKPRPNSQQVDSRQRAASVSISLFGRKTIRRENQLEALTLEDGTTPAPSQRTFLTGSAPIFTNSPWATTTITKGDLFTVKEVVIQRMQTAKVMSIPEPDRIKEYPTVLTLNPTDTSTQDFWLELGKPYPADSPLTEPKIEDVEKYDFFFRDYFFPVKHVNYLGISEEKEPVIISATMIPSTDSQAVYHVIIRSPRGDKRQEIQFEEKDKTPQQAARGLISKKLKSALCHISNSKKLVLVEGKDLAQELLQYELKMVITNQKIGILLKLDGQTTEEEMFSNREPTEKFKEFLAWLGDSVVLQGHKGFTGGLDVKYNSTGTNSVYTTFEGLQIMFHVSTMLPHSQHDSQQVEKKRHIGNDIVVIIFNESKEPYLPSTIKSEYNHVYAVIQPLDEKAPDGTTRYRLGVASKVGTPSFGPLLPHPAIFDKNEDFRNFLLAKLINAERACLDAPSFLGKMKRTRKTMLEDIMKKHLKKK